MRKLVTLCCLAVLCATPALAERKYVSTKLDADQFETYEKNILKTYKDAPNGKLRFIVGIAVPFAPEATLSPAELKDQRADIQEVVKELKTRFKSEIVQTFETIPFIVVDLAGHQVREIYLDQLTLGMARDEWSAYAPTVSVLKTSPTATAAPLFSTQASLKLIRAPEANTAGYTGSAKGTTQTIAVIENGVDNSLTLLKGKLVAEGCYSSTGICLKGNTKATTASGSSAPDSTAATRSATTGTMVAGIAAAGVAPHAKLIAIAARSTDPKKGYGVAQSDLLGALERVYRLGESNKIAAVIAPTTRVESVGACDATYPAEAAIIDNLRAAGIATVAGAGDSAKLDSLAYPACLTNVVSVAAVSAANWGNCKIAGSSAPVTSTAADKVYCNANTTPEVSLLAPGAAVLSPTFKNRYVTASGSALAAAHVAGAFALLRQKYPTDSVSTNLKRLTVAGSGRRVEDYRNTSTVLRRIDVKAALDASDFVKLSYRAAGSGSGTMIFQVPGETASCYSACTLEYGKTATVSVRPRPDNDSRFTALSGACSSKQSSGCTVVMDGNKSVIGFFTAKK